MTEHVAEDGTVRKDHYGPNRQPWDDIVESGWGPFFAAGNVLKYLRRTKDPEHSLASARWYWAELEARAAAPNGWAIVLRQLTMMLTDGEKQRLK